MSDTIAAKYANERKDYMPSAASWVVHCCVARSDPLLCCAWQSVAVSCMAICYCIMRGDSSRATDGTGHGDAMDVHGGRGCSARTTPAPIKSTASVELAGGAREATTAKPEALVPEAKSVARSGFETPPFFFEIVLIYVRDAAATIDTARAL